MIGGGEDEGASGAIGFERNTRSSYVVGTHKDLGELRRLYVRQLASPSAAGAGWYLDRIEVTGPDGLHWTFPCSSWLGRSDTDPADPAGEQAQRGAAGAGRGGAGQVGSLALRARQAHCAGHRAAWLVGAARATGLLGICAAPR